MDIVERISWAKTHLLNWDHDINPTPITDLAENICHAIATRNPSLKDVCYRLNGDDLTIYDTKPAVIDGMGIREPEQIRIMLNITDLGTKYAANRISRLNYFLPIGISTVSMVSNF